MRRTMIVTVVFAILVVSMLAVSALAQESAPAKKTAPAPTRYTCPMHPQVMLAQRGNCPMCGMALIKAPKKTAAPAGGCCNGGTMTQKPGMTPDRRQWRRVIMSAPIFLDSPSVIYGQAQELELSEGQKTKLREIESQARQKALGVLSDEQRKRLGDIPDTPMTLMQMCADMMSRTHKMVGDKRQDMPMTCPTMRMMRAKDRPATPSTESQDSGTKPGRDR